jgi:hypothetical protein
MPVLGSRLFLFSPGRSMAVCFSCNFSTGGFDKMRRFYNEIGLSSDLMEAKRSKKSSKWSIQPGTAYPAGANAGLVEELK